MNESVRYAQQVTAFPAGITTGATWDTSLFYAFGNALGKRPKKIHRLKSVEHTM